MIAAKIIRTYDIKEEAKYILVKKTNFEFFTGFYWL